MRSECKVQKNKAKIRKGGVLASTGLGCCSKAMTQAQLAHAELGGIQCGHVCHSSTCDTQPNTTLLYALSVMRVWQCQQQW
jgi:hypothetical protein